MWSSGTGFTRLATDQACAKTPSSAAPLVDLGSRAGDGQAQDLHHGHGCESLFLRSAKSLAARLERKHEWAIATILPEENRSVGLHPSGAGRRGAAVKSTSKKTLRISTSRQ